MREKILQVLDRIEKEQEVKVIYACESGSRAWGFASSDSDYDVRFLYLRPMDWYLSISLEQKRDVIELPIDDSLDVSGWDLRKALQLFRRTNPPLLEWLGSPIIYLERYAIAHKMRELAPRCYSPTACQYHYYKTAKKHYQEYLQGDVASVKKYFYVLRPVLAVIWLEREKGIVPTRFQDLVEGLIDSRALKDAIYQLIDVKRSRLELDQGPRVPVISDFLDRELLRMEQGSFERRIGRCLAEELDVVFHSALDEVWSDA